LLLDKSSDLRGIVRREERTLLSSQRMEVQISLLTSHPLKSREQRSYRCRIGRMKERDRLIKGGIFMCFLVIGGGLPGT
jgi:hypothetical protein